MTQQCINPKARKREKPGALSIITYNGKLVISAIPELYDWCKEAVAKHCSPEWCFEAGTLISIDRKLQEYGYEIDQVHIFFTPKFSISKLTKEIMKLGKVPFYGTSLSHLASQNVALRAGLVPTFCELTTRKK